MEHPDYVAIVVHFVFVDHKDPPVRSCDSFGATKPPGGDRAQESAIEVEQLQPPEPLGWPVPVSTITWSPCTATPQMA